MGRAHERKPGGGGLMLGEGTKISHHPTTALGRNLCALAEHKPGMFKALARGLCPPPPKSSQSRGTCRLHAAWLCPLAGVHAEWCRRPQRATTPGRRSFSGRPPAGACAQEGRTGGHVLPRGNEGTSPGGTRRDRSLTEAGAARDRARGAPLRSGVGRNRWGSPARGGAGREQRGVAAHVADTHRGRAAATSRGRGHPHRAPRPQGCEGIARVLGGKADDTGLMVCECRCNLGFRFGSWSAHRSSYPMVCG